MQAAQADTLTEPAADPVRSAGAAVPTCRFCGEALEHTFVDLGMSPLCESYVPADRVNAMEAFYPLHAKVCESCLLVQLEEFVTADAIFSEYAYFSSYSDSWVAHARDYVEMAVERFGLDENSLVMELASNDGYLLQHVVAARDPGTRHRARRERRDRRAREGHRDDRRVLRPGSGQPARGRGPHRRPARCQQRHGPRPRPQRLRRRDRNRAGARRRGDDRGSAPAASRRKQPVRHDLSRALLLLLAADGAQGARGARARAVRRRRAQVARRFAAALRPASGDRTPAGHAARGGARRARARPWLRHARGASLVLASGQRDQVAPARVSDRAPPRGQADRRLRRPGERATRC